MLLGALIDVGAELKPIRQVLDLIPRHFSRCSSVTLDSAEVKIHGFRACRAEIEISERADETSAQEFLRATEAIADSSNLSESAKSFAQNSIRTLIEVESKLHAAELSDTHLHEAGSTDTLADVFGVAAACDSLQVFDGTVYSCPVAVGGGCVSFSHGTVSVPAPAVLEIVRRHGMRIVGGPANEELATPTGVSMLANLAERFLDAYPAMIPEKTGYGAGKRELAIAPNVLRIIMGQSAKQSFDSDVVQILETNLDDVSGEVVGNALEHILDAGAKDAWVTSAQFKKNRPGFTLHVICDPEDLERLSAVIFSETGTLGVRYQPWGRFILEREIVTVKVEFGERMFDVRVKIARDRAGKLLGMKPEFEDVDSVAAATARSVREVSAVALEQARKVAEERDAHA
jgi:hypothetical protein